MVFVNCVKINYKFSKKGFGHTKTSIAIADTFISRWDEKYSGNLIRPQTLINIYIDEDWEPMLQTPPFPDYTRGHSVLSSAASVALTTIFGENLVFDDDVKTQYGLPIQKFCFF